MKMRRILVIVGAVLVILSAPLFRSDTNAASGPAVTDHTQDEIREYIKKSEGSLSDSTEFNVTPVNPTVMGDMTDQSKRSALGILNNIRYIAGLDEVRLNDEQGKLAQAAAFIDLAVGQLTHYPALDGGGKPAEMSSQDWEMGVEGARSCNLAWGYSGISYATLGWTSDDDASNIDRVGHRRWLLNPEMGTTGFGAAGSYYAMYSFDMSGTGSQYNVAWPARNMPVEYFSSDRLPWSISTGSIISAPGDVRVKLTRLNDNKVWEFSGAEGYSPSADKFFTTNNDYYGQPGCIIFRPDGVGGYSDGDIFRVEITGSDTDISYEVNFFSLDPITGIKLNPDSISLNPGERFYASIYPIPSTASESIDRSKISFSVEDTDIATVNADGVVTAIKPGKTKLSAEYKGLTATAELTVKEKEDKRSDPSEHEEAEDTPTDTPADTPTDTPSDPSVPSIDPVAQTGADGTALGKGASAEAAEAAIAGMKSDSDLPGAVFSKLQLRSSGQTKTSVTINWKKVSGASKYVIYGNKCGKANKLKKLATSSGKSKKFTKVAGKKIKKGTYYKFMIVALDKNNNVVSSSKIVHVATKGGKVGNIGKITTKAKKNKVSIKKGKTFNLKAKQVAADKKLKVKKHRALSYESANPKIATITKKGVIKGKKKGTCYVYAYAQNGVFAKIKVTVK